MMLPGTAGAESGDARGPAGGRGLRVPKDWISVQLYTLRSVLEQDLDATLAALADIGYRKVELAGTYGRTAAEFRSLLDKVRAGGRFQPCRHRR